MATRAERFDAIKQSPGKYQIGSLPVELVLPRRAKSNMSGIAVTFSPDQIHKVYLTESNRSPMADVLKSQNSVYAEEVLSDGRKIIIANPLSPYTVSGDHLIVWLPGKDGTRLQQSFKQLSIEQGTEAMKIVSSIAQEFERTNGSHNFFIGINKQEGENERQSVQSVRDSVHIHAVKLNLDDVKSFNLVEDKRSLHEFADQFSALSVDLFEQLVASKLLDNPDANVFFDEAFNFNNYPFDYPKGYFLKLKNGWETLNHEGFFSMLVEMQKIMDGSYKELRNCFTDESLDMFRFIVGDNGNALEEVFQRPMPFDNKSIIENVKLFIDQHPEITNAETKRKLLLLASIIRPSSDVLEAVSTETEYDKTSVRRVKAREINTKLIMDGLGYNILFFPDPRENGSVLMSIVPRVTSAGSPLDAFGIKKTQFEVAENEFNTMMKSADQRRDIIIHNLLRKHSKLRPGDALVGQPDN